MDTVERKWKVIAVTAISLIIAATLWLIVDFIIQYNKRADLEHKIENHNLRIETHRKIYTASGTTDSTVRKNLFRSYNSWSDSIRNAALGIDTSTVWRLPIIIQADTVKENE